MATAMCNDRSNGAKIILVKQHKDGIDVSDHDRMALVGLVIRYIIGDSPSC